MDRPGAERSAPATETRRLVLDDTEAQKTGEWTPGSVNGSQRVGDGYIHDHNENKGQLSLRWTPEIPVAGKYEIHPPLSAESQSRENVPVTIALAGGQSQTLRVNEQEESGRQALGQYTLPAGRSITITLSNAGTDGYVIADGVQLLPIGR